MYPDISNLFSHQHKLINMCGFLLYTCNIILFITRHDYEIPKNHHMTDIPMTPRGYDRKMFAILERT